MGGRAYKFTPLLALPLHWNDGGMTDGHLHNALAEALDLIVGSMGRTWKNPVTTTGDLPMVLNALGDARVVTDEARIYVWDGLRWVPSNEGALDYMGAWDASTNTPTLLDATGIKGHYYVVSAGGTQNLGSGPITFSPGDWAVHNGSVWQKADHTDVVTSVFGRQGAVTAQVGDYTHAQIGGVGPSDHHTRPVDGELLPAAHKDSHKAGGPDQFVAADLLDAVVRRLRETGGPTDLLVGAIPDGAGLIRSGASIIGDPGASYRCWDAAFGSATAAGFNSGSTTPTIVRIKTFPGTDIVGIPIRACCVAMSSSGNAGYVEIYRPSNGTVILTLGPITATTPTLYSVPPPWTNPWPTTEEPLHIRVYRGAGAATITAYDFAAGIY